LFKSKLFITKLNIFHERIDDDIIRQATRQFGDEDTLVFDIDQLDDFGEHAFDARNFLLEPARRNRGHTGIAPGSGGRGHRLRTRRSGLSFGGATSLSVLLS